MKRLFVTIQTADGTLPLLERVQTIYPRYLVAEPMAGPSGLTLRGFRKDTPYQGEELVFEAAAPEHFLARCARQRRDQFRQLFAGAARRQCRHYHSFPARLARQLAEHRSRH